MCNPHAKTVPEVRGQRQARDVPNSYPAKGLPCTDPDVRAAQDGADTEGGATQGSCQNSELLAQQHQVLRSYPTHQDTTNVAQRRERLATSWLDYMTGIGRYVSDLVPGSLELFDLLHRPRRPGFIPEADWPVI